MEFFSITNRVPLSTTLHAQVNLKASKKQTKFISAKFQEKSLVPSFIKTMRANSVDLDEVAHYEPSHMDQDCLQIQLFTVLSVSLTLFFLQCSSINPIVLRAAKRFWSFGHSEWNRV